MSRVELWAKDNWETYNSYDDEEYQNALNKLSKIGI